MFQHSMTGPISNLAASHANGEMEIPVHPDLPPDMIPSPLAALDFPSTPDDVRLRSQTISHLAQVGWASGLTGVALTVLGLAGLGASVCVGVQAATVTDDEIVSQHHTWLGYAFAGGVASLSALAVLFGVREVCVCAKKRREADREILSLSARVRFASAPLEDGRDYA